MKWYEANEITEAISNLRTRVQGFSKDGVDPRVRAMINTKLQEAEMLSLLLFPDEVPYV